MSGDSISEKKMERKKYFELLDQKRTELRSIKYERVLNKVEAKIAEVREVSNFEDFDAFCEKWNGKANVYAGIHERVEGGTKKDHVVCVKVIALDIDSKHPINQAATDQELEACKKETFEMVADLERSYGRPSIVMTGNGYQLLWKIRPIDLNQENRESVEKKIQAFINGIQKKYNSEHKQIDQIGDLPRILKVAGTMSVKGEGTEDRPHRFSHFIEYTQEKSDLLRDEILRTEVSTQKQTLRSLAQESRAGKFDYLLLKDQKLASLFNGNTSGYKSRSEAEMALVCKLVYYEFNDFEIDWIMRSSSLGKWNEKSNQYRESTITKARLFILTKKQKPDEFTLEDVYSVLSKWLYLKDFHMVDLVLAIVLSQRMTGSPIWMIFVGASGDGKTEMAKMIEHLNIVYKVDQITPNVLVSGMKDVKDLAPELNNKLLLITDFASILSLNADSQRMIFAQLRNLYDGEAYKDSGSGARKHYTGLRITMMANSTPVINHRILIHQDLGTRELIYRTDLNETFEDFQKKSLRAIENEGRKAEMRLEIQTLVTSYFQNIKEISKEIDLDTIQWLLEKATWLSLMRATANTDAYSGDLLGQVTPEVPTRLLMQLKVIYLCLRSLSPNYDDSRAREIILRIINSSAKDVRVKIFQYLEKCTIEQTSSQIAEALRLGKKTVILECNVLWNLNLIQCRKELTIQFGREQEISYWMKKEKPIEIPKIIEEAVV